jgi:tRNA-dihydrouridine synthase B
MIGRAAQGNPWIFREVRHYLETGEMLPEPTPMEVLGVMNRHLAQLHRSYGEQNGVRVARKHIGWYLQGRPGAEGVRAKLMKVKTAAEQFDLLQGYFQGLDEMERQAA